MSRPGRRGRRLRRASIITAVAVVALGAVAGSVFAAERWLNGTTNDWPYAPTGKAPVLATVGDISCQPGTAPETEKTSDLCTGTRNQAQAATANQIEAMKPDLVAVLGDEQYQVGRYEDFTGSFDKTYGAFKFLQRPPRATTSSMTGTHGAERDGRGGYGYFDYFNGFQLNPRRQPVTHTFTEVLPRRRSRSRSPASRARPANSGRRATAGTPTTSATGTSSRSTSSARSSRAAASPTGALARERDEVARAGPRRTTAPRARWRTGTSRRSARPPARSPPTAPRARRPTPGGSCSTPTAPTSSSTATTTSTRGSRRWTRAATPTRRTASASSSSEPAASRSTRCSPSTPNLQAFDDQHYGVMKLTLGPDGYNWDYESALRNPTAPAGTPATYSDTGSGRCHGAPHEQDNPHHGHD